jgi:lipopolysaccharide transport system ATP-binding protein
MAEIIVAQGVGKMYRLGEPTAYRVMRERIAELLAAPFRRRSAEGPKDEILWALKDVGFTIDDGEVVGLIGKNGAGKSTLLKILSRITEPTEGRIDLYGKASSLLEVGIGFHPELSGRENIYLNGAILGMSRQEIRGKFDEIVEFAEIARFLDTPVKRYSSGMYVRLAFAVAAHLEPDILIVDEVLAVGDAAFQRKCLGKMRDMRSQGRTVILVSHTMPTISSLCQKVIWLDAGRVKMIGETAKVVTAYLSEGAKREISWTPRSPERLPFSYDGIFVERGDTGESIDPIPADVPIDIVLDFTITERLSSGRVAVMIASETGELLFTSSSADPLPEQVHEWRLGANRFRCRIPPHLLAPGVYHVSVTHPRGSYEIVRDSLLSFTVSEDNSLAARDARAGRIMPLLQWTRETREPG